MAPVASKALFEAKSMPIFLLAEMRREHRAVLLHRVARIMALSASAYDIERRQCGMQRVSAVKS